MVGCRFDGIFGYELGTINFFDPESFTDKNTYYVCGFFYKALEASNRFYPVRIEQRLILAFATANEIC